MEDEELRLRFADWAGPLRRVVPPEVSVIRSRARRRAVRLAAGGVTAAAVAAAGAAVLIVTASLPSVNSEAPAVQPGGPAAAPAAFAKVPYYVSIAPLDSGYVISQTASGATRKALLKLPGNANPVSVAGTDGGAGGQAFVFAGQDGQVVRFYSLRWPALPARGVHMAEPTPVPPLRLAAGTCRQGLAGLALSPDGRTLAVSVLSDCANGQAGPSLIETADLATGRVLSTFGLGKGYPMSLSWTSSGTLVYSWDGSQRGIWMIAAAASQRPGSPRLLLPRSASIAGYSGAYNPKITPDGSAVIVTVGRGTWLEVAEFSARTGRPLRVLIPAVNNPTQYCGPLWTDRDGQHMLAACGNGAEVSIDHGRLTRLPNRWQLPSYPVPGGPRIAW